MKKNEKNAQNHLTIVTESSIIGLTRERKGSSPNERETEAREAAGKIEGIGDVLSDGSKRFLGIVNYTNVINGTKTLKINEEFDPGSERTLVACLIHASRAVQQWIAANG